MSHKKKKKIKKNIVKIKIKTLLKKKLKRTSFLKLTLISLKDNKSLTISSFSFSTASKRGVELKQKNRKYH